MMKEKLKVGDARFAELGNIFVGDSDIESLFFEPGIVTDRAGSIGAESTEKDPVMDLVTLSLHPIKESLQAHELSLAIEENLLLAWQGFFEGFLSGDPVPFTGLPHIVVKLLIGRRVPGSKGFLLQSLSGIGNDLLPIDSNGSAKSLAGRAGAHGAVEGEKERLRFGKGVPAAITGETSAEGDSFSALDNDLNSVISQLKSPLNRLCKPGSIFLIRNQPINKERENAAGSEPFMGKSGEISDLSIFPDSIISIPDEVLHF
jgi:hypothetical protein